MLLYKYIYIFIYLINKIPSKVPKKQFQKKKIKTFFKLVLIKQKMQGKEALIHIMKCFLNAIINTKYKSFFDIIKVSKSVQPNKCIQNNWVKFFI
jgi:hypothetical protein